MGNRSTGAIRRSIANQKGVIDGINARITSLSGRIERLETARDSVDGIYEDTCTILDDLAASKHGGCSGSADLRGRAWRKLQKAMPLRAARRPGTRSRTSVISLGLSAKIASLSNQLTEEQTGLAVANETLRILNNELLVANWRKGLPELRKKANSCPRKYR